MKTRFIAAGVLALAISGPTFAASTDFTDNGRHTTDNISKLDWLDVTESTNRSYNDVSAQLGSGGDFDGWRYATKANLIELVKNYAGFPLTRDTLEYDIHGYGDLYDRLLDMLGFTSSYLDAVTSNKHTVGMLPSETLENRVIYAHLNLSTYKASGFYTFKADLAVEPGDYNSTASYIGSWLIRDTSNTLATPLPAAAFMFAPALLGLLGFRRKLRT